MVAVEHTAAALYDKEKKKNAVEKTIKDQAVECKEAAGIDFFVNFYCFQSITLLFAHPIMRYSTVGLRTIKCYFLRAIH